MKYTILESLYDRFAQKLESFKRKFKKYGAGEITFEVSEPYLQERRDLVTHRTYKVSVVDVEVSGRYEIAGYEFVASLDYLSDVQRNIVKKAPNTEDIPEIYYTRVQCDHCKTDRQRVHTILLKNTESGEYVQVGKGCVKDYLGCDVGSFASYYAMWGSLADFQDELNKEFMQHAKPYFPIDSILEQAVASKNKYGYISQSVIDRWFAENIPDDIEYCDYDGFDCPLEKTSSVVWQILNEAKNAKGELMHEPFEITDDIRAEVAQIKEFVSKLEPTTDYLNNLHTLISMYEVGNDNLGLVVSMVGYYGREMQKAEQKRIESLKSEDEKSKYVGKVGERITFTAQPECVFSSDSEWGMYYIYRFKANGKDEITWKTSKCLDCSQPISITATVKNHSLFKNVQQTEITRARTQILPA